MGYIHFRDYIAPILPPFRQVKTKIFENEFQILVVLPKLVLGTKFSLKSADFFCPLSGLYPFLRLKIAPIYPPRLAI